ncbi:hypothetical protein [Aphanothece sacrum]|uniref:Uncharacterized protein n=1 Tax=Aphanothece sacrum FPU1 TaxID=1920663 RepID=A0A401IHL7_APHSA|nr:hypothetical protein [Aphanothece sacrum]GBF80696.1 hypothetical protein AsFPU1_2100 [Aphanothece sacrum FPU1]GBF83190.1 hypothetical protein AsFPU3_0229 [Aphanothece sacrum FPU3]
MERGLLWLPLLFFFCWLTWSGWNEYQKLEAYRQWAEQFEQAKYDIYAIIGINEKQITWGKPSRLIPTDLPSFSLADVANIRLLVNDNPVDLNALPNKGLPVLEFSLLTDSSPIKIPFTEIPLAAKWTVYLNKIRQS